MMFGRRRGQYLMERRGVNWTVVCTLGFVALVVGIVGPFAWKGAAVMDAGEIKAVVVALIALAFLVVILVGVGLLQYSQARNTLAAIRQDDADEVRKSQQQAAQFARLLEAALRSQGGPEERAAMINMLGQMAAGDGRGPDGQYRDVTMG